MLWKANPGLRFFSLSCVLGPPSDPVSPRIRVSARIKFLKTRRNPKIGRSVFKRRCPGLGKNTPARKAARHAARFASGDAAFQPTPERRWAGGSAAHPPGLHLLPYFNASWAAMVPDSRARGMPPPGWALPPAKYRPLMRADRLGCRRKAALRSFEAIP